MIANETIQVRVDRPTKQKASKIIRDLGLDMSTAVKMYLRQIVARKAIPFPVVTENGYTPEFEAELVKEAAETWAKYKRGEIKAYTSIEEAHKDLLA